MALRLFWFGSLCVSALMVVACGGVTGKGTELSSTHEGKVMEGGKLDTHEYHDVRGKIYGAWEAQKDEKNAAGETVHMEIHLYVKSDTTAARLICSKKGTHFADMAGIVASHIDSNFITFRQSLNLQHQDCQMQIPMKTFEYELNTLSGSDLLGIDSTATGLSLTRQTPKLEIEDQSL